MDETNTDAQNTGTSTEQVFNFEDWCRDFGLSRKTTQTLRQEELLSKRTLLMLNEEDIASFGLPLGQKKLLVQGVADLKGHSAATSNATCEQSTQMSAQNDQPQERDLGQTAPADSDFNLRTLRQQNSELLTAGKTFNELFNSASTDIQPHASEVMDKGPSSYLDPRTILSMKSRKQKALNITDFITEPTKKRRQARKRELILTTSGTSEDQIVLRPDEDHPYSGISIHEWGAANCRLMNCLLEKQYLQRCEVEYYLAYTTKLFEWAQKYEWESILEYDFRYRELQAEHDFKWGSFSPDMELHILERRQYTKQFASRRQQHSQNNARGRSERPQEDCWTFKAKGKCPFGENCKFQHTPAAEPKTTTGSSGPSRDWQPKPPAKTMQYEHKVEHSLHFSAWEQELPLDYPNRSFILSGIRDGFHILDPSKITQEAECSNYETATCQEHRPKVEEQLLLELSHGHYKEVDSKPKIVSALGAIPKKDKNKVRLIHDCSRPVGNAVNDFCTNNPFKYQSIQNAVDSIKPNYF